MHIKNLIPLALAGPLIGLTACTPREIALWPGWHAADPVAADAFLDTLAPPTETSENNVWHALGRCESGDDPTTNTGNGFYGAFQFRLSTWRAMGGTGYPHQASYAEQLQRAQALQAQEGWHPWPSCARKLGLL